MTGKHNKVATINLDPLCDGLTGGYNNIKSTAGRYLVIGTDKSHRIISPTEFCDYLHQMEERNIDGHTSIQEYIIIYDRSKVVAVDGDEYLVGSFILMQSSNDENLYARLTEAGIEEAKEKLTDHFVDLIIDGERCGAFALHR